MYICIRAKMWIAKIGEGRQQSLIVVASGQWQMVVVVTANDIDHGGYEKFSFLGQTIWIVFAQWLAFVFLANIYLFGLVYSTLSLIISSILFSFYIFWFSVFILLQVKFRSLTFLEDSTFSLQPMIFAIQVVKEFPRACLNKFVCVQTT